MTARVVSALVACLCAYGAWWAYENLGQLRRTLRDAGLWDVPGVQLGWELRYVLLAVVIILVLSLVEWALARVFRA